MVKFSGYLNRRVFVMLFSEGNKTILKDMLPFGVQSLPFLKLRHSGLLSAEEKLVILVLSSHKICFDISCKLSPFETI